MTRSKVGFVLSGAYVIITILLVATQGLFGESFIALILGLPWSLALAAFEYGNASGPLLYLFVVGPLVLNAFVLYWIGSLFDRNKK